MRNRNEIIPLRPHIYEVSGALVGFVALMRDCWEEEPARRPTFARIRSRIKDVSGGKLVTHFLFHIVYSLFFPQAGTTFFHIHLLKLLILEINKQFQ